MNEFDQTTLKWLWMIIILPITWFFRLVWTNHKSLNELKIEMAQTPTHDDIDRRMDNMVKPMQDAHNRIERKLDKLIDRELNRK